MPPRKFGVDRHPDGSTVRTFFSNGTRMLKSMWPDEAKAKSRDPRENSASGLLEIKTTQRGGITKWQRFAGERYAELILSYRRRTGMPNPNPPACDLQRANGKALVAEEPDPDLLKNLSKEQIEKLYPEVAKLMALEARVEGIDQKLDKVQGGKAVRDAIHDIFILDKKISETRVGLARRGLNLLILELGLTGDGDRRYR